MLHIHFFKPYFYNYYPSYLKKKRLPQHKAASFVKLSLYAITPFPDSEPNFGFY